MNIRNNLALHFALMASTLVEVDKTPEERAAVRERNRLRREAQQKQWKAEQDAIAAPYREARRLRNLAKMKKP